MKKPIFFNNLIQISDKFIQIITVNIIIISTVMLSSCSLFETRTPESPDDETSTFVPPTTPEIAISNLSEAVKQKNIEDYYACFAANYSFLASNSALINFPSLFDNWSADDEKNYLRSISTALGQSNNIFLTFANGDFASLNSDSAVFITDYNINFDLQNSSYPTKYSGKSSFTLVPAQNGLWEIIRWQDFSSDTTNSESWSNLKAYYHN